MKGKQLFNMSATIHPLMWCHSSQVWNLRKVSYELDINQLHALSLRANWHCVRQTACGFDSQCETPECAKLLCWQNGETSGQVLPVMPSLHALRQKMHNVMKEIIWVQFNFAGFNCVLCRSCRPSILVYAAATMCRVKLSRKGMWADIQVS
jgi:hypothetical protein